MRVVVIVALIGGLVSILIGVATAALVTAAFTNAEETREERRRPILLPTGPVYWSFAAWTILLGIFLMAAPPNWYGPSWSYFPQIPHNGFGMGACCSILGVLLMFALWRDWTARALSIIFFLIGFVYWTAGVIMGAEGLLGHMGLMETPFMLYIGAHAFVHSAALMAHYRKGIVL